MSTLIVLLLILIVIAAVVLGFALLHPRGPRERRRGQRRVEARGRRAEAERRLTAAASRQETADRKALDERAVAQEHAARADAVDPDR